MADYPSSIYEPREVVNQEGHEFDPDKTNIMFAEDKTDSDDEIVAIETELGLNPKGEFASVAAAISYLLSNPGLSMTTKDYWDESVSDNIRNSNDTERTTSTTTPDSVKLKEVRIDEPVQAARLKWSFQIDPFSGGYDGLTRLYKNGSPVEAARNVHQTEFLEVYYDFGALEEGDLIQIYGWCETTARTLRVKNMRFCYDNEMTRTITHFGEEELTTEIPTNTTDQNHVHEMTNQDP